MFSLFLALCLFCGSALLPPVGGMKFLVGCDNSSLSVIEFTFSARPAMSTLNTIAITTSGTLVSDTKSPNVILQVSPSRKTSSRFRVELQPQSATLISLTNEHASEKELCMVSLYTGQHTLLAQHEMKAIEASGYSGSRGLQKSDQAGNTYVKVQHSRPQMPSYDSTESEIHREKIFEHNQGICILDSSSQTVRTLTRDDRGRWKRTTVTNVTEEDYQGGGVGVLAYGRSLYSLKPKTGILTRHFLGDPSVPAQHIHLDMTNSNSTNQIGTLLLSSRSSHFPKSYIYATRGSMLFILALPNDPTGKLHVVARIKTSLSNISSAILVSVDDRYLILGGEGGLRAYQRVFAGASVVEIARLNMKDTPTSLLWL